MSRRMSGSSSTIRISCAMGHLHAVGAVGFVVYAGRGSILTPGSRNRQDQADAGAGPVCAVFQQDGTAMVLQDLLDDGEAEAGALGLVRHVRFRQSGTVFLGQADAVIADGDTQ